MILFHPGKKPVCVGGVRAGYMLVMLCQFLRLRINRMHVAENRPSETITPLRQGYKGGVAGSPVWGVPSSVCGPCAAPAVGTGGEWTSRALTTQEERREWNRRSRGGLIGL